MLTYLIIFIPLLLSSFTIVENEDLKISAISVQYLNDYGVIELILENKSNKLVSISLDKLFFSGIEIEALISCDIPPEI